MLGLFRQITGLLRAGMLTSPVEATSGLDQVRAAVEHAQRPGRHGKVLLKM
jgi:NADPH:quinone reductase-like Zn-dependent oxidoreductase